MSSQRTWVNLACGGALLALSVLSAAASLASDETNPYSVIVAGNAFRLNPPPPPPTQPEPPPPDLPTVIFSGTVTIGAETKAMFAVKTKEKGAKGAMTEETQYISLKEDDTEGPVKLVQINPGGEEVVILNSGTRMVLNLKDNGFEKMIPAGSGGSPGMRGAPGAPGMPAGMPGQPPIQTTANQGINVGYNSGADGGRGGISVGGRGGAFSSANPQVNMAAIAQTLQAPQIGGITPVQANTAGVKIGGNPYEPTPEPIPFPSSPKDPRTPQPNSTPPNTVIGSVHPPMPPIPGQ